MTPDEDGCYTIPADYSVTLHHDIFLEDACGNKTYYNDIDILWNYLEVVREKDHWDETPARPIRITREQNLQEELSKVNIGVFASDVTGFIPVDVSWEIPEDYDPQSPREQTFTVLGTVILEGTGERCRSGLDVITRPGEEWKKNFAIRVTVEGAPRYRVTVEDSANGSVTVVNGTETAGDGTPLFYKDEPVMLSIAPDEGYMLSTLSVNGIPATVAVGDDTYTFAQPEENVTITATFEKRNEHTVTFDANGGSEPEDLPDEVTTAMPAKKVLHGSEYYLPECEFIAPENQQFKAWEIDGAEYPVNAPVTVTADITVKALWKDAPPAPAEYTVTVTTEGNGTASASPAKAVAGEEITLTATPDGGYHFKEWQVISGGVTIKDDKFTMPSANVEVKAIFEKDAPPAPTEFIVTFDAGGGTPSVDSMTTTNQKLTSLPSASRSGSYSFDGWYTEKSGGTKITTDTVFHAGTTVYAHWTYTGGGSSNYSYYTIKATAGTGGSITPSGNVSVREGRDKTFTITLDKGYTVSNVKIDGRSIGAVKSYTFENVKRAHTIEVSFTRANEFIDIPKGGYFEDAVDWAVENGITTGTDASHFSPDDVCTRAQAVTFLWRAAGCPQPKKRTMPFTDVPKSSYFYDAVLWAVEAGITKGTSDTKFSPYDLCTRAQIAVFLWRSEGSPLAEGRNPFADVAANAYYADAVLWAVAEDITMGTSRTTFSPDDTCTRAQIVTFLWRCKK